MQKFAIWIGILVASLPVLAIGLFLAVFHLGPERLLVDWTGIPARVSLKTGSLSANFQGERGWLVQSIRFRANGGDWHRMVENSPRLSEGGVLIELPADALREGRNDVDVTVSGFLGAERSLRFSFVHATDAPSLPRTLDWSRDAVEVQDGVWETVETPQEWRLRPVPGREGYDRLVLLTPSFAGGRGVSVEVTFHRALDGGLPYGFGILPLWGGHNDTALISPRRGWNFGIAWFYSEGPGMGLEFSHRAADAAPHSNATYADFHPEPGATYLLEAEAWPVGPENDIHNRMRFRWSEPAIGAPGAWVELSDDDRLLAAEPSAVALVAHRAQVEFGPVSLYSIPHGGLPAPADLP